VAEAIAIGTLTLDQIRNGVVTTRALLPGAISSAPIHPAHKPAPVAPAGRAGEAEELLDDFLLALLELPGWSDSAAAVLWSDVAVALPDELFDRLDRYIAKRLAES
jgi:hypothetical protein